MVMRAPPPGAGRCRPGHYPPGRQPRLLPAGSGPCPHALVGHLRRGPRPPRRARRARSGLPRPAGQDRGDQPRRARPPDSVAATSWCLTWDRTPSSRPGTSPEPALTPSTCWAPTCGRCPPTSRSSPTAASRSVCSPTMPCACSAAEVAGRAVSPTGFRSGARPGCRPTRVCPHELPHVLTTDVHGCDDTPGSGRRP